MGIDLERPTQPSFIRRDFNERGTRAFWLARRRLSFYPEESYQQLISLVDRVAAAGYRIKRIRVDSFDDISRINLSEIPEDLFGQMMKGSVLDLRGLQVLLEARKAEQGKSTFLQRPPIPRAEVPPKVILTDKVRALLSIVSEERKAFEELAGDVHSTAEDIFSLLIAGVGKFKCLGFHATVFRPLDPTLRTQTKGRWREVYRAESWGEGAYSGEDGATPKELLLSVLKKQAGMFRVDLEDAGSFLRQHLAYSPEKIRYDLLHSKGSPEILIFKLDSDYYGVEAVIYVNNRVDKKRSDLHPLPYLFPPGDAKFMEEALISYFSSAMQALNVIRNREREKQALIGERRAMLSTAEKKEILRSGQLLRYQDQRVRLIEVPSEKFLRKIGGVVAWLREVIISIYEGTEIAEGKNFDELIRLLSLEDEKMIERVITCRYLVLIEGDQYAEEDLKGIVSGTVLDINDGGPGVVFRVPEAMIKREARGRKLQVAVSNEMVQRVFRKTWAEKGLFRGFFHMLTKGIPFYATTQSLRVVVDLMRLKDISILRTIRGIPLAAEQKKIIATASQGKADEKGVEKNAYGGRIAIDREEKGMVLRRPLFIFDWPVIGSLLRFVCSNYIKKLAEEDEAIKCFMARELGVAGRLHIVGNYTLGVAFKVWLELKFGFGRKKKTTAS